jgi:hypothetical protein
MLLDHLLRDIRLQVADQLKLEPRKVELKLPDGRVLAHCDDMVLFIDLLGTQPTSGPRRQPGNETGDSSSSLEEGESRECASSFFTGG